MCACVNSLYSIAGVPKHQGTQGISRKVFDLVPISPGTAGGNLSVRSCCHQYPIHRSRWANGLNQHNASHIYGLISNMYTQGTSMCKLCTLPMALPSKLVFFLALSANIKNCFCCRNKLLLFAGNKRHSFKWDNCQSKHI